MSSIRPAGRSAWLEVNLDAIRANVHSVLDWVGEGVELMAVVKANAYGHGLVPVARAAVGAGCGRLAVAIPAEALALRQAGIAAPVLVMGACEPADAEAIVAAGAEVSVSSFDLVEALREAAVAAGRTLGVHLKVDTGMGRVGVSPDEAAPLLEAVLAAAPAVRLAGLMTHFATADEDDTGPTATQLECFRRIAEVAAERQPGLLVHAANSPGTCRFREAFDAALWPGVRPAIRAGLLVYGVPPVAEGPALRPALSLKARVTQARDVPAGTRVSYGSTFVTQRPSRLAVAPLGYADGYGRANSGRASVLLRGRRAPVAGRVCMDQFVVDATDTGAEVGDEVVLIGRQGNDEITVNELAGWGGTVHHEVLARLGERLPRVYTGEEDTSG